MNTLPDEHDSCAVRGTVPPGRMPALFVPLAVCLFFACASSPTPRAGEVRTAAVPGVSHSPDKPESAPMSQQDSREVQTAPVIRQNGADDLKDSGPVSQKKDPSRIYGDEVLNAAYREWRSAGFPRHPAHRKYELSGKASWYGPGLNGNSTASGETFDMYGMTAAHRKLPFGSIVLVTNEENGKSVVVRINDRGPFIPGRVIDLSYGAAHLIGMVRSGVVRTRVEIIRIGDGKRKTKK